MLTVSATTLGADGATHAAIIDEGANLTVVLLELQSTDPATSALREQALDMVCDAVRARTPMYEIVSTLRRFTAHATEARLAACVLRVSPADARVELLNAGMAAVACVLPDQGISLHPALSDAIGTRFADVHPYELSPLVWGSTWFVLSPGLISQSASPEQVSAFLNESGLAARGPELSELEPQMLGAVLADASAELPRGPASLVVLHSDATRRFRSGIVR